MQNTQGNQAEAPAEATESPTIETFEDGVSRLEGLLGPDNDGQPEEDRDNDKEEDNSEKSEDESQNDETSSEEVNGDEDTDETEDGPTEDEESTEESEEDAEDSEDPLRFAEDLVVQLGDEETTLGNIVETRVQDRVKSFQADYTRKTQEVAEVRRNNEEQTGKLISYAEDLRSQRDTFLQFQEQFAPTPPDISMVDTDPIGYQQQKAYYDEWVGTYNNFANQAKYQNDAEMQRMEEQKAEFVKTQKEKMVESIPELGTDEGFQNFRADLMSVFAPAYGYTPEDLNMIVDHRFAKIAKDAIAYQKLQQNKPKAKAKLEGKPVVLKPKKARKPAPKNNAENARKKLARTGDLDDAVAALMNIID